MSLAIVQSRANVGIRAKLVEVEVHLSNAIPKFSIVGLPETAVKESKDRVRSALINCGFHFPYQKITVNLAPADLPKDGGRFDLAIALGILIASKQLPADCAQHVEVAGELGLSGELRSITGCLPMVVAAQLHQRALILPRQNATACAFVPNVHIFAADNLLSVCHHLSGKQTLSRIPITLPSQIQTTADFAEVYGQYQAKRALEIAAAGGHSVLLIGTPGSGKTMLASRLPSLLPTMTDVERVEVATIASLATNQEPLDAYPMSRPFRSPHHSVSDVALIGGGRSPRPGEVSLAHRGVLFLDELPEFNRSALEALREPLEAGEVLVSRAAYAMKYPAQFQLVAAMNPCICGYWGDETGRCRCNGAQVQRYQSKISGPLLDRIDLQLWIKPVQVQHLLQADTIPTESSSTIRARVTAAVALQLQRTQKLNRFLSTTQIQQVCALNTSGKKLLQTAITKFGLSARSVHRILKVARTVADLTESLQIQEEHLQEVLMLRQFKLIATL